MADPAFVTDQSALDECAVYTERQAAMGCINDQQAFLSCCRVYDSLLRETRVPSSRTTIDKIVSDKMRADYFRLTVILIRETKLDIKELAQLLSKIEEHWKKSQRKPWQNMALFVKAVLRWCAFIDFEPAWHMRKRGDTRPLPSSKRQSDDVWGYLRRLYTDPEAARLRMPDGVRRKAKWYKGYEEAVNAARAAGQAELRRKYGDDVDLSLVSEVKSSDTKEDELNFFDILMSGGGLL